MNQRREAVETPFNLVNHSAVIQLSGPRKMLPAVIVVLMLISFTCGENPAIQVILTSKGLQYGKHIGTGLVQEKLEHITLPDFSGKVFGIHYILTGHDGGSFNMAIFGLDVTSVVKLGKDPEGHLSVTSVSCDAQVGDVDIQFEGGASWMFQPFVEHFKGRMRGEIMSKICPNVEESIVSLEYHLQAMEVSIQVDEDLVLDIPLTGVPVIDASSMILSLKGEFYDRKTHEPPFEAQNFTVPEQPDYMLSMGLSEFTVNSASYALYSGGRLHVLITDSMIPPYIHYASTPSSMGPYVPQLPKMFPGLLMNLQVYASEVPMLSFQPGVVKLDLAGVVKASAIEPNSTQIPLFKLNVDLKFDGKVWVAAGRLKGSMALQSLTLTLAGSEVGHFETDTLESLVKMGVMAGLAKLNVELGKGVDLPRMRNAQLVNTVLGWKRDL
ncbi:hypothetical protein F7725_000479 [Dissostichus mawsoni]|uniref:Bactericidal permeability-increasing protein n=1 Tax=Dissostichus mawsoni TaxID=36200 RepID=A0A7J5ZEI4_DISMA|nr:hypothetical protein F7725_000479 [Dissostichus mawsoni]